MNSRYSILLPLLMLTACAGTTTHCPYSSLKGEDIHGEKVESLKQSGKDVRILYPDSFIGFSKNSNRINLIRDENDKVAAVSCG